MIALILSLRIAIMVILTILFTLFFLIFQTFMSVLRGLLQFKLHRFWISIQYNNKEVNLILLLLFKKLILDKSNNQVKIINSSFQSISSHSELIEEVNSISKLL